MADRLAKLVAVGDVQPHRERPEELFEFVREEFAWGDLRVCQLEATLSSRGTVRTDVRNPAHRVPPAQIGALTSAGFDVVTFAGNNNLDYGLEAFYDTIELCREHGIVVVGAGRDLAECVEPRIVTVNGTTFGFVDFCSILRDGYAATPTRAGIAPLRVSTFYEPLENIYEQPGTPARTVTVVHHRDLERALDAIARAKALAEVVVASFHWGVHFTHDLATYQPEVAYAAVDAGADIVLGTHPHCLQAVDVYRGKYILYSLGNFAFEQKPLSHDGVRQYLSFYDLPLDPELPQHPHPTHCRKTVIAKFLVRDGNVESLSLVPVYFNGEARPEPLRSGDPRHEDVLGLIQALSGEIGTQIELSGDEALVLPTKDEQIDAREWVRDRLISYPWLQRLIAQDSAAAREPVA